MIDYCTACGIENKDGIGSCKYCSEPLQLESQGKDRAALNQQKLYVNLTEHPVSYLLRGWKALDLAAQLLFPVSLLFVFINKLLKRPFLVPILNAPTPKFRITEPKALSQRHPKKAYGPAMARLEQQGYRHCLDLSCLHYNQIVTKRIFVNQDHTRYATIFINAVSGKVQFVSMEGFTSGKKFIAVLTRELLPITLPQNVIFQIVHSTSPDDVAEALTGSAAKIGESLVPLSPAKYLRLNFKVDKYLINQAVREGLFLSEAPANSQASLGISGCVNHPMRAAVRCCTECDALLCESCYTTHSDAPYCSNCFSRVLQAASPAPTGVPSPLPLTEATGPILEGGYMFAGMGARGLAKVIDLASIAGIVTLIVYGFNLGLSAVAGGYASALANILTQLIAVAAVVFYFTIAFQRMSGGIGHRILGMRVVDKNGHAPSLISGSIRLMYHLLSCLFIFPAVGYLSIPFRQKKRGWHDTLADTWVVTKHPKKMAAIGWLALFSMCSACGWYGFGIWQSFTGALTPDIAMESLWEIKLDPFSAATANIRHGNLVITRIAGKITALDMQTGHKHWSIDASEQKEIKTPPFDVDLPLILTATTATETVLLRLNAEDGTVLWRTPIGMKDMQTIVDRRGILVWNQSSMKWFDVDGVVVWQSVVPTPLDAAVAINEDIFITRYHAAEEGERGDPRMEAEPTVETTCISLIDGSTRWHDTDGLNYEMGRPLGNGYSITQDDNGNLMMVYLPERRTVWTASANIGPVVGAKQGREQSTSTAPLLYTDRNMVVGMDGSVGFKYPTHINAPVVTDQWLIMIEADADPPRTTPTPQMNLLVIDRFNGEPVTTLPATRHEQLVFLSEDEFSIYLFAMNPPLGIFSKKFPCRLLLIDKRTHALREINLGDKFIPWGTQVRVLRDSRTIFIAASGQMGAYLIPPMEE